MAASELHEAEAGLDKVRRATTAVGWSFLDLESASEGVGLVIGWGERYVVLSVLGSIPSKLWVSAGLRRDVDQDARDLLLEYCNASTRSDPALPVYLHDGDGGWDLLLGSAYPLEALCESSPEYFGSLLSNFPVYQEVLLGQLQALPVGGQPYVWTETDRMRLFLRALT